MDFLQSCIMANHEIYHLLKSETNLKIEHQEGFGGDISLEADLKAEAVFIKYLQKFGRIYSEESGMSGSGDDVVIIDPIDGSKNFASNIPYFGSSAALKKGGEVVCAVVANFAAGYMRIKDKNRFERRFFGDKTAQKITLTPLCGMGIFEKSYQSEKLVSSLSQEEFKYRSLGALALSLSLAYEVDFVLFEGCVREFDIAGGWYMCEGLFRFKNDKFLLVSKDKGIFDKISNFIKEQSVDGFF
ncbi:MAG: inositol monophosphatase [Campylobacteraceae bacterium]|jgi:myo-inositol-1(or 4)-monophosphatase|nr:inositol monophosphatase [Campylobacteraceae bacterium]